jgi:hypothetical protein
MASQFHVDLLVIRTDFTEHFASDIGNSNNCGAAAIYGSYMRTPYDLTFDYDVSSVRDIDRKRHLRLRDAETIIFINYAPSFENPIIPIFSCLSSNW